MQPQQAELSGVLEFVAAEARKYIDGLLGRPVRAPNADDAVRFFDRPLPEEGDGAMTALRELVERGMDGVISSSGPRFFHFVIGGTNPAALGADWLASAVDQNNGAWIAAPLAAELEMVSLSWLKDLFGLPEAWAGVLTTGATMANFSALACARRWWGLQHGIDVDERGLAGLDPAPVLSSGYIHPSATKALAMLGIGRATVQKLSRDPVGRLDLDALEKSLAALDGAPAIVVANAGEVNAGDFDPIDAMADLAERYGAWLHVDGAFGLFAAASPQSRHLVAGVERAHSVIADGHKWLNVPYDCGFAFVRDPALLGGVFTSLAAYLPQADDPRPNFINLGPESSRRARSLAVWASLRAYGRAGYRDMVEHHLALAQRVAARVDDEPDLERLADVPLNIVCFRYRPDDRSEEELNELNLRLGEMVLQDGRVYVGTTIYEGRAAFRPAIVNWQTTESDVDLLVDVIRELGRRILAR